MSNKTQKQIISELFTLSSKDEIVTKIENELCKESSLGYPILAKEQVDIDFRTRLENLKEALTADTRIELLQFEINPPCEELEINKVNSTLDQPLDETFLNYFRACNGFQFSWKHIDSEEENSFGVSIPSLQAIFSKSSQETYIEDELHTADASILGDIIEKNTESNLYDFDTFPAQDSDYYYGIAVVPTPEEEPVVLFLGDNGICFTDNTPMTATAYMETIVTLCGDYNCLRDLNIKGFDGNHTVLNWSNEVFESLVEPENFLNWKLNEVGTDEVITGNNILTNIRQLITFFPPRGAWNPPFEARV